MGSVDRHRAGGIGWGWCSLDGLCWQCWLQNSLSSTCCKWEIGSRWPYCFRCQLEVWREEAVLPVQVQFLLETYSSYIFYRKCGLYNTKCNIKKTILKLVLHLIHPLLCSLFFFSPKLSSKLVKVPSHAVAEWLVPLSLEDLCKSFSPGASALQRLNKWEW